MTKQRPPVVALAFPSTNPVPSRRRMESKARAQRFGEVRQLGESSLVARDTFGYIVPANSSVPFLSDATASGGRVIPFREAVTPQHSDSIAQNGPGDREGGGGKTAQHSDTHSANAPGDKLGGGGITSKGRKDGQGIEAGAKDPKNRDGGKSYASTKKSKVRAGDYGKSSSKTQARGLKEGEWLRISDKLEATQVEMSGTQPIGDPRKGEIHPGKYYVLGVEECKDGKVVTLGKVDKLAHIGSTEEGRYLYNVDGDQLMELFGQKTERSDPSMAKGGEGGCLSTSKKSIHQTKKTRGGKKEGIIGAAAGAAQTAQRESQVTADSTHSRGLKILEHLNLLKGKADSSKPLAEAKSAVAQKTLVENSDLSGETPKAVAVPMQTKVPRDLSETLLRPTPTGGGDLGGTLTGGPFDVPHPPGLDAQLQMFRQGMQSGAHLIQAQGVDSKVLTESQISESMGGVQSMDPTEYALRQKFEAFVAENEIDVEELSDEDIEEILAQIKADSEEPDSNESDGEEDTAQQSEDEESEGDGGLFEDLEPGDVTKLGGLVALLKSRQVANAEMIASKLEAGASANEWFGEAGMSLQDAKRLQWLYVQSRHKGTF